MLADVAAIQYMYGANFNTNSGDTIYRWSSSSGQLSLNGQFDPNIISGRSQRHNLHDVVGRRRQRYLRFLEL